MNTENAQAVTLKQKATHELVQLVAIFLYLAFFFCSLATYSMLLLIEEKFRALFLGTGTPAKSGPATRI
jgi:hypothetical protein